MVGREGIRVAGVIVLTVAASGCAWLERSSVSSAPANVAGTTASGQPAISQSGRYVAFASAAPDLVPGDTNGVSDVFVRDNVEHTTTRISVATAGTQGNGASSGPDISDDGRYVAFASVATNLAPGATGGGIFVRDRTAKTTANASVGSDERPVGTVAGAPVISGDGRTVAFTLITAFPDVPFSTPFGPIVRHLADGTTSDLRGQAPLGSAATMPGPLALSDDGTRVASIPYVLNGDHAAGHATVRDTTTGTVISDLGSVSVPIDPRRLLPIALSGDGKHFAVGFVPEPGAPTGGVIRVGSVSDPAGARRVPSEYAAQLALSDTGARLVTRTRTIFGDVAMVADAPQDTFRLVSTNARGNTVAIIGSVALSGDGNWVAFDSAGTDVAPGDSQGVAQTYTRSVAMAPSPPS